MEPKNAARITFTGYYFCLEFGHATKKENAMPKASGEESSDFTFSPEITAVFAPEFATAMRFVLLDGVIALETTGRVKLPPHFNVHPDHNPFVYPAMMTKSGKPESYAHAVKEGTAYPGGLLGWLLRQKEDEQIEARSGIELTVVDTVACVFDEGKVGLELSFLGGDGRAANTVKLVLEPDLVWQTTTLVSDMIVAYQAQYGRLRGGSVPSPVKREDAARLRRAAISPTSFVRIIAPPENATAGQGG